MKTIILLFTLFSSCVPQSHQHQTTVKVESDSNKIQNQNSYYSLNQKPHTYIPGKYRIYIPFTIENKKDFRTVEFTLK